MVRQANEQDIDQLTAMARDFIGYSAYGTMISPSDDDIRTGISAIIRSGGMFVAEVDGKIVGAIAGAIAPMWFAPSIPCAIELAWWVDPAHRMTRIPFRLMATLETWAKDAGAKFLCMSELVVDGETPIARMLARMGYVNTERSHVKEI
jgi:GNAT superfamily N-acetyltransferase